MCFNATPHFLSLMHPSQLLCLIFALSNLSDCEKRACREGRLYVFKAGQWAGKKEEQVEGDPAVGFRKEMAQ